MSETATTSRAPGPTQSAVVVPVQAAEIAVAEHRAKFDLAASWGVGAHVTVLFPFVDPGSVDERSLGSLRDAARAVEPFECVFHRTAWFETDVLWLAPEPDAPFRALTEAVCRAFPDYPPYGGEFEVVVPHLTIGAQPRATHADLIAAETEVQQHLPIAARVDHVALIAGTRASDSWLTLQTFPLGAGSKMLGHEARRTR
jgi:2'-5' RNA ligase superfamily